MNAHQLAADVLKAMAHPVRLQIMQVLQAEGEACVCHLEAALGQRQAYISQQLATLREAGLVEDRREGLNVFYAVASDEVGAFLSGMKKIVIDLNPAGSTGIEFSIPSSSGGRRCGCPKCEAQRSLSAANTSDKAMEPTKLQGEK
jgi:ArsR family transcriptional regulator